MARKLYSTFTKVLLTTEDKELLVNEAHRLSVSESDVIRQLIRTLKNKKVDS